jgi:sigma-B regulation protein RsbU (phosphoserine phosphatase)
MEEELAIAKEIQKGLLPNTQPQITGFEIAGVNHSSREVGGDYFDWIRIDENHYGIAIADVSGKGTPAALLMANLQAMLRTLAAEHKNVGEMVGKINNLIHANTDYSKFITFFYGDLDLKEKTFKFSNAGHNPPYLLRANGEMETLIEGGLLLGMMPDVHYEEREISLGEGDCILMFTDGITEAMDENENEFGEDNVAKILADYRTLEAASIIEKITDAVKEFVKDNPQSDDITLVAIKVES